MLSTTWVDPLTFGRLPDYHTNFPGVWTRSASTADSHPQNDMEARGEEGTHSILDIVRISNVPEFGASSPLPSSTLLKIFVTAKPTHAQIQSKYEEGALEEYVWERWQGIYIIAYRNDLPDEFFFAGCSGD